MGYTSLPECSLDLNTPQEPRTVWRVRVMAGFTHAELASEIGVEEIEIMAAESGGCALTQDEWRKMLEVCGRRAFDVEGA